MNQFESSDIAVLACEIIAKASLILTLSWWFVSRIRHKFPAAAHLTWVIAFSVILVFPIVSAVLPWRSVVFLNLRQPGKAAALRFHDTAAKVVQTNPAASQTQLASSGAPGFPQEPEQPPQWLILAANAPLLVGGAALWLIGFLAVALRSVYGFYCLRMIRRFGTNPISSEDRLLEAERLAREAGQNRAFDLRICATAELPIPMTWGVVRPTILLPRDSDAWSEKRFEATMLHELSHIRRCDFATQLLAEFVCALYWFNPIVWLAARTMRSDAELAADEAVLCAGLKPSDYAAELLSLAADLGRKPIPLATLGTPAMTNSKIETRLESILSPSAGRRGITSLQVLAAVAITAFAVPTFGSLHASAQTQSPEDIKAERTVALSNAKQIALATIMYANDYDNVLPYVQQTASAVEVLQPYIRNKESFNSPTKGGRFLFNMNLAGVLTSDIQNPALTPLWIEVLPDAKMSVAVAFSDGHAKLIDPKAKMDAESSLGEIKQMHLPAGTTWLKAVSSIKPHRDSKSKPLPYNYLLPVKP